ncbi:MAG: glycoside hydrolase family 3 protein [Acidimicrobiia bacterium]|nr:glycoside hydrolase family 3 protein [Acidimicrobiia bacterium]
MLLWLRIAVVVLWAFGAAGCASSEAPATTTGASVPGSAPLATTPTAPPVTTVPISTSTVAVEADPIGDLIGSLTLEEKAAQLLMVEFSGGDGSAALALLDDFALGGFLLKSANGNLTSSDQVRELTARLQEASAVPLLIAIDQEGGRIDRVRFDDVQRFPSAQSFGSLNDVDLTERAAWATGVQLASLGINVDFAPVADVNVLGDGNPAIGDRSYGNDPNQVAEMTVAALDGFRRAGIGAAVKHFPGHGNTTMDSHFGLPVVQTGLDEWAVTDRVPFAAAVEAGVRMVMVAHVAYPALDAEGLPASMSVEITDGQLRRALGFTGVIVTDDLANMQAIAAWGPGERAVEALRAGSDLLLNPGDVEAAVGAIVGAVADGILDESVVDEALRRLLTLRVELGISDGVSARPLDQATAEVIATVADDIASACQLAGLDC